MNPGKNYNNIIETLVSIFTVFDGELKVLLLKKQTDPYKGYWVLPGELVKCDETLEDSITDAILEKTGLSSVYLEQSNSFSSLNRNPEGRVIAFSFIALTDSVTVNLKRNINEDYETSWFSIDSIPKMGYDHDIILEKALNLLKNKLSDYTFLKYLFPSDFTLPELQSVCEQLMRVKMDRRNFRKKILNSELIESTGDKNEGLMGRPANLYRFKIDNNNINTFSESA